MSSTPQVPRQRPKNENRRVYARRRINQLVYASFGPGNGGILLNLSEGGVSFQGIGGVHTDQLIQLSFKLPGTSSAIEAHGEVVWANDSGKGGGLRFLDMTEEAREQVQEWIAVDSSSMVNLAEQAKPQTGGEITRGSSSTVTVLVRSVPVLEILEEKNENPEIVPARPEAPEERTSKPPQILESIPVKPDVPPTLVTPASAPSFALLGYPESPERTFPSPQFVLFATGVLAGCVGVLAAIVTVRLLVEPYRPPVSEIAESPAALHETNASRQDSRAEGIAPEDRETTSRPEGTEAALAAAVGVVSQGATQRVEAVQSAIRPEVKAELPPNPRQKSTAIDHPYLALPTQTMTAPSSKVEVREAPAGGTAPATSVSTDAPKRTASSPSDQLTPPEPAVEKVDGSARFLGAVLIQHDAPIYPPSALKKHIEGLVTVNATIGTDGVPRELKLVSGDPVLAQAAEEAISHWRYVPAVSDGVPVESQVSITINFQSKP